MDSSEARDFMHIVVQRCISDAGNLAQALGLGKVVGQIYAFLYFSPQPRGLADLQSALRISKGSASTCVRQLEQWGAVTKVPAKGDRRDYYVANDWFGKVLKNILTEVVSKRFADREPFYDGLERELDAAGGAPDDTVFIRERLEHIRRFEGKARKMWGNPLLQRFLK